MTSRLDQLPVWTQSDFDQKAQTGAYVCYQRSGIRYVLDLKWLTHPGGSLAHWIGKDITERFAQVGSHSRLDLLNRRDARVVAKIVDPSIQVASEKIDASASDILG